MSIQSSNLVTAKAKCLHCEAGRRAKYNVTDCKVNRKSGWQCLTCGEKFTIEDLTV